MKGRGASRANAPQAGRVEGLPHAGPLAHRLLPEPPTTRQRRGVGDLWPSKVDANGPYRTAPSAEISSRRFSHASK